MITARAFHGFRFPAEVILWAVRWYLRFPVSYRDLELILADHGIVVDHVTLYRRVQCFAPELEKRLRRSITHSIKASWWQPLRDRSNKPAQIASSNAKLNLLLA